MPKLIPRVGALLTACLALSAAAQSRPDPADARAKVPPVAASKKTPSPQSADDPPPVGWRAANARVERVGGWRTYARESLPPEKTR